ncbi:wax ester/triacylglycerol synthase domain-containing protein [Streptomyces chrestomyceticus]|uniref:wax ester/triacylglycerol synthase domain-containing protein n=1 Tax=Streptomyces chrestomyceticus TaxID=68185 RepID=UPI0033D0E708
MSIDHAPLHDWALPGPMNGGDAWMWRVSRDPRLPMNVVAIYVLASAPDWERVRRCFKWCLERVPRLRQRVLEFATETGPATWSPDPEFRLDDHLRRIRLPGPGDRRQLLHAVEWWAGQDLDRTRAPWEAILVEGYKGDKAALILKWHHCFADGIGIVQMLRRLLPSTPEARQDEERPFEFEAMARAHHPSLTGLNQHLQAMATAIAQETGRAAQYFFGKAQTLMQDPTPAACRPPDIAWPAGQYKLLPGSALLRRRGLGRRFETVEVPGSALRRAAERTGTSTAAVFVAAVLGACQKYHRHFNATAENLSTAMPVNLRDFGHRGPGNHIGVMLLRGAFGDIDPAARVRAVHELIKRERNDLVEEVIPLVSAMACWIPGIALRMSAYDMLSKIDLWVSSVPGYSRPCYIAGAEFVEDMTFAPRAGSACNATMVSHGDTSCVALNIDPAAFTDPSRFHQLVQEEFTAIFEPEPDGSWG